VLWGMGARDGAWGRKCVCAGGGGGCVGKEGGTGGGDAQWMPPAGAFCWGAGIKRGAVLKLMGSGSKPNVGGGAPNMSSVHGFQYKVYALRGQAYSNLVTHA